MSAIQALAETKIKFSGFYKVFHENDVNFTRSDTTRKRDSDSFFWHRLQLVLDFAPTEDVTVRWVLRGPNTVRWGQVPYGDARGGNTLALDVFTRAIYATITTDYGKFVIGRHNGTMVGNVAGLETLGYAPKYGDFLNNHIFDWNLPFDGITYQKKWDNGFGLNLLYVKENSHQDAAEKDADKDRFGIEPFYLWDGGGASVELSYAQDKSTNSAYKPEDTKDTYPVDKNWIFTVNPALFFTAGDFSFHLEGKAAWSETVYKRRGAGGGNPPLPETKVKDAGLGLYADVVYKYGPGSLTLGGWYFDGSDLDEGGGPAKGRKKGHDLVGPGSFSPFLVAYGSCIGLGAGKFVNVLGDQDRRSSPKKYTVGNHWALALLGDHFLTKDIKFRYGLGFFRLVNPQGRHLVGRTAQNQPVYADDSKDLGYEFDVGVIAKILDNLTFESHFGYFINGDAFKKYDENVPSSGQKAKDTFAWANALVFTF
ncbi:MAG: hypothetical protein LBR11_01060 [Deltaproteobacteria bacterium]|nr:hypothetical protein [Deltaproteobacteria bacterium]